MSYTVIGLFENKDSTEKAANELNSKGITRDHIDISSYRTEGDYDGKDYDYERNDSNESFWSKLFGSDSSDRDKYSHAAARSHVVTVHAVDKTEAQLAGELLDDMGARDVDELTRQHGMHTPTTDRTTNERTPQPHAGRKEEHKPHAGRTSDHKDESVDVVKEDLKVGKREVSDGDVKLKSRIIEKPVEENVRLKNERVYVKRKPADRDARSSDYKEKTIEMKESHEEAVVKKDKKVVEEVSLEKDVEHRDKKIKDSVKETKVDVDEDENRR